MIDGAVLDAHPVRGMLAGHAAASIHFRATARPAGEQYARLGDGLAAARRPSIESELGASTAPPDELPEKSKLALKILIQQNQLRKA